MLASSRTTSPNGRRKRRQPVPVCSEATPSNNSVQDGMQSSYDGDFPVNFCFSSTRSVRRRLSVLSDDLQQPNSTPVHRSRKKRRPYMLEDSETLSHRLSVLSCSPDGGEASASSRLCVPSNGTLSVGSPKRLKSCMLEPSAQRSIELEAPSCSQNTEDVSQPDGASSLQFCRKCKPSALQTSRRLSRRLNQPSCSRDEDGWLPSSTIPVSSNGHRHFCKGLCDETR